MSEIKLGQKVRDKVTGFDGIVVAKINYISGCSQCGINPQVKSGEKYPDCTYIDNCRLEVIGEGVSMDDLELKEPGGCMIDAPI